MKTIRQICCCLISMLSLCLPSLSQDSGSIIGDPPNTQKMPVPFGFYNLQNLNMHLEIPLVSYPARGVKPIRISAVYDSAIWVSQVNYGSEIPQVALQEAAGMRIVIDQQPAFANPVSSGSTQTDCSSPSNPGEEWSQGNFTTYSPIWTLTDPYGTQTQINTLEPWNDYTGCYTMINGQSQNEPASYSNPQSIQGMDSSGTSVILRIPGPGGNFEVWAPDGSYAGVGCTGETCTELGPETPNGNYGTVYSNGIFTDDLGVAAPSGCVYTGAATNNLSQFLPSGTTEECTFSIPSGTSFVLTYTAQPVWTDFFPKDSPDYEDFNGTAWFATNLSLPDGTSYTFSYDTGTAQGHYGELTQITLPTGGNVQYQYGSTSLENNGNYVFPLKAIIDGGNTTSLSSTLVEGGPTTTVTLPARPVAGGSSVQDVTVYSFPYANGIQEFEVQQYSGSSTLVKTTLLSEANGPPPSVLETWAATGQTHEIDYQYAFANYVSQKIEKYNGNPFRTVNISYIQNVSGGTQYNSTYGMYSYPTSVTVTDNANGNALVSKTTYGYDEYSANYCKNGVPMLKSIPGVYGHDDNHGGTYAARGNVTSVTQWISGSQNQVTHNCYDTLGNVTQTVDGNNNPTTYSNLDNYSDNTCISANNATYAFPTTVTDALGHQSTSSYYSCARMPHVMKNPNDIAAARVGTTYGYDDWMRPTSVSYPDGGSALTTYTANTTTSTQQMSSGQALQSETIYDGMGRVSRQLNNGGGTINSEVDTTYDALGHTYSKTNPHTSTSSPTDGTTTYYYDASGNRIATVNPDSSSSTAVFTGTCVLKTDEAGHKRQACSDGLGRLVCAAEPNPSTGSLPNSCNSSSIPSFGNGGNWVTTYKYDALNNLVGVSQPGDGTRLETRSYSYDGLSRPVTAQNPETGTICYGSVSGSTCTASYDGAGVLHKYTDARGAVIQITVDALNRPLTRTYTTPSPVAATTSVSYGYDGNKAGGGSLGYGTAANEIGQLSQVARGSTAESYTYDPMGRTKDMWTTLPSSSTLWHTNLQYDLAGDLTQLTYPDGRVVTQTWYQSGWLQNSTLLSFNGTSVNKAYVASAGYYPSGSPMYMIMGDSNANNTIEAWKFDSRLRICEVAASIGNPVNTAPGASGSFGPCGTAIPAPSGEQKVIDNLYNYTANSNVQTVTNSLNSIWTETTSYDYRDNLHSWSNANGSSETYTIDPWGCLTENGTHTFTPSCAGNIKNQLPSSGSYLYDAAGNMVQDGPTTSTGHLYAFDADGDLANVGTVANSPTATYTYDGVGSRVRKDFNGTYIEYIWAGNNVLAQHNADGTWSDNIFANGRRIARSDSFDRRIQTTGTYAQTGVEAGTNFAALNGYTVKSGDHIYWRQYNSGGHGGLNIVSGSQQAAGIVYDTAGVLINDLTTESVWVEREVDLTSFAGLTITNSEFVTDTSTPVGTWSILFGDISLVHPDGTVIPIYNRGTSFAFGSSFANGSGVSNQSASVVTSTVAADAANPTVTTTYYVADQIGSSRMDIAYGSWPTWWGAFDPYGAEIDTNSTSNNFKFSGKERDAQTGESGLDNFGARAYSSNLVGKFMQPDPAGLSAANLWNPQSFYLYGYVMNNPLTNVDPTGMESCAAASLQMTTGNDYEGGVGALFAECETADPPPPSQAVCTADSEGNLNCTVTVKPDDIDCNADPAECLIVGQFRQKKSDAIAAMKKNAPDSGRQSGYESLFCLGDALKSNGLSLAFDAVGLIPAGGSASAAFSLFHGAAGISNGTSILNRVKMGAGIVGTASSSNDGNTYGTVVGVASIGAAVGKAAPVYGQILSGLALAGDAYKTYKDQGACVNSGKYD